MRAASTLCAACNNLQLQTDALCFCIVKTRTYRNVGVWYLNRRRFNSRVICLFIKYLREKRYGCLNAATRQESHYTFEPFKVKPLFYRHMSVFLLYRTLHIQSMFCRRPYSDGGIFISMTWYHKQYVTGNVFQRPLCHQYERDIMPCCLLHTMWT